MISGLAAVSIKTRRLSRDMEQGTADVNSALKAAVGNAQICLRLEQFPIRLNDF
jgi:hypothetical protein